jgi:hypothetical protein
MMVMASRSKWAAGKAVRAGLAVKGTFRTILIMIEICCSFTSRKNGAGRDRRATQPPAHFRRNQGSISK